MSMQRISLTGILIFFIPCAIAIAQEGDPFGGSDPFGDPAPAKASPLAEDLGDPFGRPADPEDGKRPRGLAMDPFGTDSSPFGGKPGPKSIMKSPAMDKSLIDDRDVLAKRDRKDTDQKIRAALNDEISQSFLNTPLNEAIATISRSRDIPIVLDVNALEEIGLTPDVPISIDLKSISLRSFLRLMLRDLDCTYVIKDEVMQITTTEAAERNRVTIAYKMDQQLASRSEKIVKAMTTTVTPSAWNTAGGPCSVVPVDHVLVVSATEEVHVKVADFMKLLSEAFEESKSNQ